MLSFLRRVLEWDRLLPLLALVAVSDLIAVVVVPPGETWGQAVGSWLAYGVGVGALAFRHRWPVPVAAVTLVAAGAYYPVSDLDGTMPLASFVIALYTVAVAGHLAAAVALSVTAVLAITYAETLAQHIRGERNVDNLALLLMSGWFVGVIAFGHATRTRQAYLREAEQRALAAERERDTRARQSAIEERLRLARELHDVIGHTMSLIHVQSAAAVHRSAKRPGETVELVSALNSVRDISKEGLRELRATLGVLREADEDAPTEPVPGLERLPELVERARSTGLHVTATTAGEPPVLPAQISFAVYRIAQESLTNIIRHSGAAMAWVKVAYTPGEVRVEIEDDGLGADDAAHGSGIGGMAERARSLGGELTAGNVRTATDDAVATSGFLVAARLPLPDGSGT